jgi:uncharacterized protein YjbI with pentapeptide repeats
MDQERLKEILESHGKWLRDKGGRMADLRRADLSGANLYGADLRRADLSGADLRRADLSGANLRRADLSGANLRRADLREADLSEADLHGANILDADLRMADLHGANLFNADLRGADLHGADLRDTDIHGANLHRANMSERVVQVGPIGSRRDYTIFWVDRNLVQCGCWNDYEGGSLDEFKKRVNETYPAENEDTLQFRNEYLAAIAMFERLRDDARQSV